MVFDAAWAEKKIDLIRRERELSEYINHWLPELKEMDPGFVIDIGCGPGDFLAMCTSMGHRVLGIDAPNGDGGMGDPYLELCKQYCEEFGIEVWRCGLKEILTNQQEYAIVENVTAINLRGSIEQCFAECLVGQPHDVHHNARLLDWIPDITIRWFDLFFLYCFNRLKDGGILLISANGTRTTDEWYSECVQECARNAGLHLVDGDGKLIHKWRK